MSPFQSVASSLQCGAKAPPAHSLQPNALMRAGRYLSILALLLAILCYGSLIRFSSLSFILAQVALAGLLIWNRRLPLYVLAAGLFLFGNQPAEFHTLGPVKLHMWFVDMTLWMVVGVWLAGRIRKGLSPVVRSPITIWLILFWAAAVCSLLPYAREYGAHYAWAARVNPADGSHNPGLFPDPMRAVFAFYQAIAYVPYWPPHALLDATLTLLFFFYLLDAWRTRQHRNRLLLCLCAGLCVSMLWGILDSLEIVSLEWFRTQRGSPLAFAKHSHRLQSFFSHAGWYAEYLAMLAPCLAVWALAPAPSRNERRQSGSQLSVVSCQLSLLGSQSSVLSPQSSALSPQSSALSTQSSALSAPWLRAAALGAFLVSPIAMLLTYQRGGWYALLLSFLLAAGMSAVLYLRRPGLRKWGLAILVGSALLIAAGGIALWIGARNEESPLAWRMKNAFRVGDRRDIWASALELSRRYPWGAGLGFYYLKHITEFPEWHPYRYVEQGTAHNHCLHVLVESGPFAVLCLLAVLLITSWRLTRAWWNSGPDYARAAWTIGCLAVLAGWVLHGMVQYMAYIRVVDLMFYALLAFSMAETDEASAS